MGLLLKKTTETARPKRVVHKFVISILHVL
jgi:hypothetical protein